MIRILLADDHPVVREGLVAMLSTQSDMEVVAQAGTGEEALALQRAHGPDVIVVDLNLPDIYGDELIRQVRKERPDVKFLVLTAYDTDDRIMGAIRAGAHGYLVKGAPKEDLFDGVRTVYRGGSLLGPGVAPKVLGIVDAFGGRSAAGLSDRELEVLKLTADGMTNKEIGSTLSISERTVKFHLTTIYQKLGVSGRTEAIRDAARRGIIGLAP